MLSNCAVEHLFHETQSVHDISFTGSEFATVFVLLGKEVDAKSESLLLLLHCAISRATENIYVICHIEISDEILSLLALSGRSDIIFEKLRSSANMGPGILEDLEDPKDKLEILKRLLVTQNRHQFEALRSKFSGDNISGEELQLLLCNEIMQITPLHKNSLLIVEVMIFMHSLSRGEVFEASEIQQLWNMVFGFDVWFPEDDIKSR